MLDQIVDSFIKGMKGKEKDGSSADKDLDDEDTESVATADRIKGSRKDVIEGNIGIDIPEEASRTEKASEAAKSTKRSVGVALTNAPTTANVLKETWQQERVQFYFLSYSFVATVVMVYGLWTGRNIVTYAAFGIYAVTTIPVLYIYEETDAFTTPELEEEGLLISGSDEGSSDEGDDNDADTDGDTDEKSTDEASTNEDANEEEAAPSSETDQTSATDQQSDQSSTDDE
jgi:hypothetical protein